jgi:hypothetical protein
MRSIALKLVILFLFADTGCGGSPTSIKDCKDSVGRGATGPNNIEVSCTPIGNDVQCLATASNSADLYVYCPISLDATADTRWISSNAQVAVFDQTRPGFLRVVGSGLTFVTANYPSTSAFPVLQRQYPAYYMSPGQVAEAAIHLTINVLEPSRTPPTPLQGVQITVEPERGPNQSCMTKIGTCDRHSLIVLPGHFMVRATKEGYQPVTKELEANAITDRFGIAIRIDMFRCITANDLCLGF